MIAGGSTYYLLAWVIVGAMALVGLGLLFVRAENIERPNLVAAATLVGCLIATLMLWNAGRTGINVANGVAWGAILVSILSFFAGRIWDAILGGRDKVHHDDATLGGDLAD
jgi:hypothetical protein